MASVQGRRDFVVEIMPLRRLSPVHLYSSQGAGRAELTDVVESNMSTTIRNRGHATTRADAGSDDNWTEVDQTSTEQNEGQGEALAKQFPGEFSGNFCPHSSLDELLKKYDASKKDKDMINLFIKMVHHDALEPLAVCWLTRKLTVHKYPEGLPQLAAFINSDETFLNYPKFGRVINRVILHRLLELAELAEKLDQLDFDDAADKVLESRLRGYENFTGWDQSQRILISKIEAKYIEYANLLLKLADIEALGKAPRRNYLSLFNWVWQNNPLGPKKMRWLLHEDDFVSLAKHSQKDRWAKNAIEGYLDTRPNCILRRFLQTQKEKDKANDDFVDHYVSGRLTFLGNLLAVVLGTAGLLIPVFLLFLTRMSRVWMCITGGGFVILSTTLLSSITGAKPHELLFGMAANAAVVFITLGNMNDREICPSGLE